MNHALITGASKGIGKEMAIELAKRKCDLLLVARSADMLGILCDDIIKTYGVKCRFLVADLSLAEGIKKVTDFVVMENIPLNILINNAGYGLWGRLDERDFKSTRSMMHINMFTPVELCYSLLPLLKKSKEAYILNVASTAAYQAVPTLAVYAASKSFMILFSRALRRELKKTNVSVTVLSPGATDTNFMNAAGMHTPEMLKRAAKFNMDPATVAKFAIDGMFRRKNEIIPGMINKISVALTYFVPKALTEKIAADLYK